MPDARFEARVGRLGINYCVDVPIEVSRAFGGARYVPVLASVAGGAPRATTLVPRGEGAHRLFLHAELRSTAGVAEGDTVEVALRPDPEPDRDPVPDDLADALDALEAGPETFVALPVGLRREALRFLAAARRPETRERRIERILDLVLERRRERAGT